jgi:hypothetical protein
LLDTSFDNCWGVALQAMGITMSKSLRCILGMSTTTAVGSSVHAPRFSELTLVVLQMAFSMRGILHFSRLV